jgi:hypothetical protein
MRAHQVRSYRPIVTTGDRTTDATGGAPTADHGGIPHYEIRVRARLGSTWSGWFDGLSLTSEDGGTTVIRGPVVDQAALHGVLQKLRDVGIPLISLVQLPPDAPTEPTALDDHEGN